MILLGPPGSGKGTQAERMSKAFDMAHLSTGDVLRQAVEEKSEVGVLAKGYMDRGALVPDEVMVEVIRSKLPRGQMFLLDGFPRTIDQAQALDEMLESGPAEVEKVLHLAVKDDVVIERLLGRKRADDTLETIRHRLDVYRKQTEPLIDYYTKQDKLAVIDGDRSMDEVFGAIQREVGN